VHEAVVWSGVIWFRGHGLSCLREATAFRVCGRPRPFVSAGDLLYEL